MYKFQLEYFKELYSSASNFILLSLGYLQTVITINLIQQSRLSTDPPIGLPKCPGQLVSCTFHDWISFYESFESECDITTSFLQYEFTLSIRVAHLPKVERKNASDLYLGMSSLAFAAH